MIHPSHRPLITLNNYCSKIKKIYISFLFSIPDLYFCIFIFLSTVLPLQFKEKWLLFVPYLIILKSYVFLSHNVIVNFNIIFRMDRDYFSIFRIRFCKMERRGVFCKVGMKF